MTRPLSNAYGDEPSERRCASPQTGRQGRRTAARGLGRTLRNSGLVAVAVVAVAGGSAEAGSLITGSQIAANTIRGRDIHDNTLRGIDVKNGSLRRRDFNLASIRGAEGAAGAPGAQGPEGPPGQSGIAGVRFLSTTVFSSAGSAERFLSCAPGEVVLGGGAESTTLVDYHVSMPFTSSQGVEGWLAEASVRTGTFSMDVKAVCGGLGSTVRSPGGKTQ